MSGKHPILEKARSIAPLVRKSAATVPGEIAPDVIAAFREHNLFSMYVPESHGGLGLSATQALELIEAVSYEDGGSGWVLMAAAFATGASMGFLSDDDTVSTLWNRKTQTVLAGTGAPPPGRADATGNGNYIVSGRWSYGSGVKHADYVLVAAAVFEKDGTPRMMNPVMQERRMFIVPRQKVSFAGNWDVIGLETTGSIDYTLENIEVSEAFSYLATSQAANRGPLFRLGYISLVPIGHAGWALGIGRRILDELALFAQSKKIPGGVGLSESFQEQFAHHEAAYRGARAFLFDSWRDMQETVAAGKNPTTRQETLTRISLNHITSVCLDIANFAYRAGGGTSLRAGVIQRFVRDMMAGAQHMTSGVHVMREAGKELSGLEQGKIWAGWMLIDPPKK